MTGNRGGIPLGREALDEFGTTYGRAPASPVKRIRPFEVDERPMPTTTDLAREIAKARLLGQVDRAEALSGEMGRRIRRAQRRARRTRDERQHGVSVAARAAA
jgi:hypothetical protein